MALYEQCRGLGIEEITVYCFTKDNTKRPSVQKQAFERASVDYALEVAARGAAILVMGDEQSAQFPKELARFRHRQGTGMRVNLLVNYGWEWDLAGLKLGLIRSHEIIRMEMIVGWGGGRRLSGFLPVQSVYADFYVRDELWPDFKPEPFEQALKWFQQQDQTLGG